MKKQAINKTVLHYLNNSYLHTEYVDVAFPSCVEKFLVLQSGHKILYTNMPEVAALDPFLNNLNPKTVLDLGCGIGRGSVYLYKRYQWNNTKFILYDGNSGDKTLAGIDRKGKKDFYNDLNLTKTFFTANGIQDFEIINAEITPFNKITHSFDLVYSFLAIGFHWSIAFYLNDLAKKINPGGLAIFGMQGERRLGIKFTEDQVNAINPNEWKILLNLRCPHLERKSVLVLEKV